MGAQNGKDLLIKLDMTGSGQFETIAGLRATRISFNAESVDVTSLESADAPTQLRALASDKVACTYAYGSDLRRAADEIERLRAALESIASCESNHPDDVVAIARRALVS